jgi:chromosome segregation ATPase
VKILETLHEDTIAWGDSTAAHTKATAALAAYAAAHKLSVDQVMKMVAEQGDLSASLEKTDADFAAQIGNLDSAASKMGTFAERTRDAAVAMKEMNAEADRQTAAIQKRNDAIDAATQATSDFAAAQREGIAFQGQATTIQIQAIKATAEQTAALVELLKAQNTYNDSLQNALTAVDQWNNYLAILTDSYKNGATSLLAYRQALEMFLTQLQQNFGTATGKAKEGLDSVIAAVQKLINTAGAGGSADQSMSGALNRALNKP